MKKLLLLLLTIQCTLFSAESNLDRYIRLHNDHVAEGHMNPGGRKEKFFIKLFKENPNIKWIAETGFNAGHSSECFLEHARNAAVVSFDIMQWSYAKVGKKYIDAKFPGRHDLIEGDSLLTVVEFAQMHRGVTFDFIFIDGGHAREVAKGDIKNFKMLAHPNTLLVVDDLQADTVKQAWKESVKEGVVEEIRAYAGEGTRWVLGRYKFH